MTEHEMVEFLKRCDLFDGLDEEEIRSIAKLARMEEYGAGETIQSQGTLGEKLYIVFEGEVVLNRVVTLAGGRRANVTVYVLRQGRMGGCWCALVGKPHVQMCSAICYRPSRVLSIPCADLRRLLLQDPRLGLKVMERLVLILRERIESSYGAMETL